MCVYTCRSCWRNYRRRRKNRHDDLDYLENCNSLNAFANLEMPNAAAVAAIGTGGGGAADAPAALPVPTSSMGNYSGYDGVISSGRGAGGPASNTAVQGAGGGDADFSQHGFEMQVRGTN